MVADIQFGRFAMHSCEVELADGCLCAKPTIWQSVYTFNAEEKRFLWICDDCRRAIQDCLRKGENSA
jgi:hypothetical protein